jgi:hypothetical protein
MPIYHRFAIGQGVLYTEHRFPNLSWKAPFTVIDLLPSDGIEPQYRILSRDGADDQIVGEHALNCQPLPHGARRLLDGRAGPPVVGD